MGNDDKGTNIHVSFEVYSQLLARKQEIIRREKRNASFDEILRGELGD